MAEAGSRTTTTATTKTTTKTMKAPAQASTVPLVPLSALSKAHSAQQKPPLSTVIQRIHKQQGHFRNVTEAALLEQIRADTEVAAAAERRQREEREKEDEEKGGASSDGVSGASGRGKRGRKDEEGEEDSKPAKRPTLDAGDEAGRREFLQSAKEEIMRQVGQAYMEAYYALDFVSLLLSKEMPRQAEQTLSQHLKQFVPPGSLDLVRVQAPPLQQATSVAAEQDSELVHTGWKIQSLNTTADTLMAAAARLTGEIEHETRYWQEVLAVHQKGWPLCRMPRERHTLGVNFGFMEAAADFRDRSLAALRRGVNGRIVLDQALSSASARDGKPRALRVRIGRRGTSSSSSSKGRPLIAIVGSSSAPMSTSTTATASSSSALSSEVRKENNHKDNDISDDHRRNNSEVAKGGSGGDSVANHDDELQSDNNADRSHDNAAAAASFPPVEDLIVQARNAIFEEELFHELAREARTLTNRGVRTRDATIMLPLPRAPPQQSRQAQPSAQQPPSSMPTFRLPFNRPFTQAPEDDVEEYIILDLLPLEEFPIATTTTDKRNVAQAPSGEARQQGGGGERREQEGRGGEELQRQGAGEGENYEEGHDEEDEEQEQEATFLAEGIALTLRILLARAHQLNLQRRSQPPPPLRAPDRANAPAAARGGGLALLPPPPPPPYAILRPVLARLSTPLAAPVPASFAAPPATSSSGVPNIASVSAQQPSDPTQQPPAFSFTAASAPSGPSAPPAPSASQAQPHAQSSTNSGQRHHHNLYYGRPRHLSGYTHHHEQLLLSLLSLMKSLTVSSPSSHPHSSSGKT